MIERRGRNRLTLLRVGCYLFAASAPFAPSPKLPNSFNKVSIFSFVTADSYRLIRRALRSREIVLPLATSEQRSCVTKCFVSPEGEDIGQHSSNWSLDIVGYKLFSRCLVQPGQHQLGRWMVYPLTSHSRVGRNPTRPPARPEVP